MLCYAVLCQNYAALCRSVSCCAVLSHAVLCFAEQYHVILCHVMACCAVLCHAVSCYAVQCCSMIGYAIVCCPSISKYLLEMPCRKMSQNNNFWRKNREKFCFPPIYEFSWKTILILLRVFFHGRLYKMLFNHFYC